MKISKIGFENPYQINQIKHNGTDKKQDSQVKIEKKTREEISLSIKNEIRKYKNIIKDIPEVREERIRELKKLIEQGKYRISVREVGNKLLEEIILGMK